MAVTRIPDVIAPSIVWPCTARFARLAHARDNQAALGPLDRVRSRLALTRAEIGSGGLV